MMRHFMEKPQLLGAACDSALLTRCWHRLSGVLSHGAPDCQSVAWRLRQGTEGAEFAAELVTLCGQLIREAELRTEAAAGEQQQSKERKIQQQDLQSASARAAAAAAAPQSPHSCDRRTSASQLTGILSTVCSSADCVIRHLKRLVEATTATAGGADVDRGGHGSAVENINAIGNRLGESISRLTSVLDSAGASLRVKPAYLARLDQLKSGCLTSSLSSLSFEFFYSVFTDTLLLRRSLGRRLLQADSADAASSCTGGKAATAAAADQLMLETAATN
uniref:MitMem_reg domain-containing protein n=1 Tax=Macrostomum lignano TaxID=282301 RepID=A0A1I8H4R8_9PLAT